MTKIEDEIYRSLPTGWNEEGFETTLPDDFARHVAKASAKIAMKFITKKDQEIARLRNLVGLPPI
jgi:hypothetical protein